MPQPTTTAPSTDPGVTDVLDLLGQHDGDFNDGTGQWIDVQRAGQPIDTARVQLTDTEGRVRTYRVRVEPAA